ncbi:hypothetical protein [Persephonella sp. KM09-Lau-8]|uniref:hypothetical protein n=1 Tax=Persephonella sp. KM09-Lau-8 TaxID=1158345 RepID=UPI0004981CAA|nr:hypothetical protein [Persephonella sp. KM09-Lau-8]
MQTNGYRRELALRNAISIGLECSNPDLFRDNENFIINRWGDPSGWASAEMLEENQYFFLEHKYVVGYLILTIGKILEMCGKEEEKKEIKKYLKQLDATQEDEKILKIMDTIIDKHLSIENGSLEELRGCCK